MASTSIHSGFTGSIPENYDTYLGPILFEFSGLDMAHRVAKTLIGPARILEVACGTGISTRHLANILPKGTEIIATDLNPAMLDHAAKVNGRLAGVSYSQADALDLPFAEQSFDAVVCQFGIMFFPDKTKGMAEMTRVLKPGGSLALNVWDSFDHNPAAQVVDRVIKSFFTTDPPRFLEVPFGTIDETSGRQLFANAGYMSIDVAQVTENITITDHSLPARGFITGNPTLLEIELRATVGVEEIVAKAVQALESAFGSPPVDLRFQETVFLARKPDI